MEKTKEEQKVKDGLDGYFENLDRISGELFNSVVREDQIEFDLSILRAMREWDHD